MYSNMYLFCVAEHDKGGLRQSIRQAKTRYNFLFLLTKLSRGDRVCLTWSTGGGRWSRMCVAVEFR